MKKGTKKTISTVVATASVLAAVQPAVFAAETNTAAATASAAINKAAGSISIYDFITAKVLLAKVPAGADKDNLTIALNKVAVKIFSTQYNTALTSINQVALKGYSFLYLVSNQNAINANINAVTHPVNKIYLQNYFKSIKNKVFTKDFGAALNAVIAAEGAKTQASVDAAQALVNQVANAQNKAFLQARLNKVDVALAVKSVTAVNAKQIQITFNKAIDESTIIDSNAIINNVVELSRLPQSSDADQNVDIADAYATLSDDDKTVTITAADATYFEGTYGISVSSAVRSSDADETLATYTGTFTANEDTTAPTVSDVTYDAASGLVKVIMSEPVETQPTVTVDGGAPVALTPNDTNTEFTFANTADAGSTIKVAANGAVDIKGNEQTTSFTKSIKISYLESNIKVTSAKQTGSNEITVVFDRSLSTTGADAMTAALDNLENNALTVTRSGIEQAYTATFDEDDATNSTVILTFTAGDAPDYAIYPTDKSSATLTLDFGDGQLTDIYGNTNDEIVKTVTMTKDTVAPTIQSIRLNADKNAIEVLFNEDITALDLAGGITVRQDGVVVTALAGTEGFRAGAASADGKLLTIPYEDLANAAKKVPTGSYTVRLAADTISDAYSNNNAAIVSPALAVTNTSTTSSVEVDSIATADTNTYTVAFTGKVGDSALLASSYSLNGAALPSGTDIVFTDSNKDEVTITLPDSSVNYTSADAVLRVVNVKDTDGNKVAADDATVTVTDNVKPVLTKAVLTGNTLVLTYSENMDNDIAAATEVNDLTDDLEIKGNSLLLTDLADATNDVTTTVDGKTVTITFTNTDAADNNWAAVKAASKITIKTLADGVFTDANGTAQKDGVTVTVVKQ